MLTAVLEAFETALDNAEAADVYQKTARKLCGQIDALVASVDALPEELRPTIPTEEEIARLRALTSTIIGPELQALKAKVEAALTLGVDAGLVDFDEDGAKALVERYSKLSTSMGTRRGTGTGRKAAGLRQLSHPMRVTIEEEGKAIASRVSGNRTGGGDWTWVRWQITDHARSHGDVVKEALDAIRAQVASVEAGEADSFEESVMAEDGTTYTVSYPYFG